MGHTYLVTSLNKIIAMKKFLLSVTCILCISGICYAGSISISGASQVCPYQDYTYDISSSFLFGTCGTPNWWIHDSNGLIASGSGSHVTYSFPAPANQTYTISAVISGGLGCFSTATTAKQITTKYPEPSISGPSKLCPGATGVYTASVSAPLDCFHHSYDWQTPAGWTATTNSSGSQLTLTAPYSTSGNYYNVSARTSYTDRNEYGDFNSKSVYAGPPNFIVAQINGPYSLSQNSTGTWTAHMTGNNTNCISSGGYTYKWYYRIPSTGWVLAGGNSASFSRSIGLNAYLQLKLEVSFGALSSVYYTSVSCSNCGSGGGGGGGPISTPDLPIANRGDKYLSIAGGPASNQVINDDEAVDEKGVQSIEFTILEEQVQVFPNPASDKVSIMIPNVELGTAIGILNLNGKLVKSHIVNTQITEINLTGILPGVYVLQISSTKGQFTQKLIIR